MKNVIGALVEFMASERARGEKTTSFAINVTPAVAQAFFAAIAAMPETEWRAGSPKEVPEGFIGDFLQHPLWRVAEASPGEWRIERRLEVATP